MNLTTTAFGTWSGGRFMHFGEQLDVARIEKLVQQSWELGVRTFATSDVYGVGRADELLGRALKGIDRSSYCIAGMLGHDIYDGVRQGSKGYPRFTDPALRGEEDYEAYLKKAAEKSLERCDTDYFDLVMLHNPDSIGYTSPAVWDAMEALKSAKLTERIGIAPGPANGFVLDLIDCFEKFGERMDWAMLILNPLEPWPQCHVLPTAEKQGVDVITRVVDYGGMFHDVMRPGHQFKDGDHRAYRPKGWVEIASEKIEKFREIGDRHDLTLLQLACQWNLAQPAVKSVVPTLIQEGHEGAKTVEEELEELSKVTGEVVLSADEIAEIQQIGDNTGCMALKGASERYADLEAPLPDQWPVRPELLEVASRFQINPAW
ncbi:MAG: aldo/keto reductase [Verrucomicrobiota bacterium]